MPTLRKISFIGLMMAVILAFSPILIHGKDLVPRPVQVPGQLPEPEKSALLRQYSQLLNQAAKLEKEINDQNGVCGQVPTDDQELKAFCLKWRDKLRREYADHSKAIGDFRQEVINKTQALVDNLQMKVATDQRVIRSMGLEKRAEEFEEWEKLAEEAKMELKRQFLKALLEVIKKAAIDSTLAAVKFSLTDADAVITQLKSVGLKDPYLFEALRNLAGALGKPEARAALDRLLDRLGKAIDITTTPTNDELWGLAVVITIVKPEFQYLVIELELAVAAVYNNVARRVSLAQVERLTQLTEEQLKTLKVLSELMKKHMNELKEAKRALAGLTSGN